MTTVPSIRNDNEKVNGLREGERVTVVEWGVLRAEATVTRRERNGHAGWFVQETGEVEDDVPPTQPSETTLSHMR